MCLTTEALPSVAARWSEDQPKVSSCGRPDLTPRSNVHIAALWRPLKICCFKLIPARTSRRLDFFPETAAPGTQISSNCPWKSLVFGVGVGDRLATLRVSQGIIGFRSRGEGPPKSVFPAGRRYIRHHQSRPCPAEVRGSMFRWFLAGRTAPPAAIQPEKNKQKTYFKHSSDRRNSQAFRRPAREKQTKNRCRDPGRTRAGPVVGHQTLCIYRVWGHGCHQYIELRPTLPVEGPTSRREAAHNAGSG